MQTFRNQLKTDEAALTAADIDVIFCGIQELQEAHDLFVAELQPLVDDWSDHQQVAEPIKVLVSTSLDTYLSSELDRFEMRKQWRTEGGRGLEPPPIDVAKIFVDILITQYASKYSIFNQNITNFLRRPLPSGEGTPSLPRRLDPLHAEILGTPL